MTAINGNFVFPGRMMLRAGDSNVPVFGPGDEAVQTLHRAVFEGHLPIVKRCIEEGVDPNSQLGHSVPLGQYIQAVLYSTSCTFTSHLVGNESRDKKGAPEEPSSSWSFHLELEFQTSVCK